MDAQADLHLWCSQTPQDRFSCVEAQITTSLIIFKLSKTIDHLYLKLLLFCRYTASLKILISKVQDFGNFNSYKVYAILGFAFVMFTLL